jgi:hypothetical protein
MELSIPLILEHERTIEACVINKQEKEVFLNDYKIGYIKNKGN